MYFDAKNKERNLEAKNQLEFEKSIQHRMQGQPDEIQKKKKKNNSIK